jgi:hypothetical protein
MRATNTVGRPAFAALRAGSLPIPVQVPVWVAYAASAKHCFRCTAKSTQCCQFGRLSSYRTETVCRAVSPFALTGIMMPIFSSAAASMSSRSKLVRDEIKWGELLSHFRAVQSKHEKARRQGMGSPLDSGPSFSTMSPPLPPAEGGSSRPAARRRVTGQGDPPSQPSSGSTSSTSVPARPPSRTGGLLSPLNPRSRVQGGILPAVLSSSTAPAVGTAGGKPKRTLGLPGRKT